MSYKLQDGELTEKKKTKFSLPKLGGRIGVALFFAGKEIFLGVQITDVIEEQIVKRRVVRPSKATVRVLRFEP